MFFTPPQEPPKAPIVTVWVHGTRPDENLPPFLAKLTKNVSQLLCDDSKGLQKIIPQTAYHYPFLRAKALATTDPNRFSEKHFYTFGWSGKLNIIARKNAALELFNALKLLVQHYLEIYGYIPEIILISHSHGGNVILHLAEIYDETFELHISKAILLACPVQKHTENLISSAIFERIYSLHSHTDIIQIVDPQGLHCKKKSFKPFLSERHFDAHPKLAQALIRWKKYPRWTADDQLINKFSFKGLIAGINTLNYIKKGRGLFHVEFGLLPFISQLPIIINQLDALFDNDSNCPSHKDHDIVIEL